MNRVRWSGRLTAIGTVWACALGMPAFGQLPTLVQQDFQGYSFTSAGNAFALMPDQWGRYRAGVDTNAVDTAFRHGWIPSAQPFPADGRLRYWASPNFTGNAGELTFNARIWRHLAAETTAAATLRIGLAPTNNLTGDFSAFVELAQVPMTAVNTNWTGFSIQLDQFAVTNRHLVIGRSDTNTALFRVHIDDIVLRVAPSVMTPVALGLQGGGATRFSNATLSPVFEFTRRGAVTSPQATLWHRYTGGAWSATAMVASGNTYVLAAPLPAGGASNRQFEMYVVLEYGNELGAQSHAFPTGGATAPMLIDILPFSANTPVVVRGGLTATLAMSSNLVWRGGMEREAGVAGATYEFAGPGIIWGSAAAPAIPYAVAREVGARLPSPAQPLQGDIVFGLDETLLSRISAEYGHFQSFENWAVTSTRGWTRGVGVVVTNAAALAQAGTHAVFLPGGTNAWLQTPTQSGIREIGYWFRRIATGTNTVTVTVQEQVGGVWINVATHAGLPSDQYDFRAVMRNNPNATAVRLHASGPAVVDGVAVTHLSSVNLFGLVATPDPARARLPVDVTVGAVASNGAAIVEGHVTLQYRYGTTGVFTPITLIFSNGLYRTREVARIPPAPDASQPLQYFVTALYNTWDSAATFTATTPTNTVEVIPFSNWSALTVANGLQATFNLATNQYWQGAVLVTNPVVAPEFWFEDSASGRWGSRTPRMQPTTGTATNSPAHSFRFTNTVAQSLAVEFQEATQRYTIQNAMYEPFQGSVLQAGWTVTNVVLGATPGRQGESGLTTAAGAVVVSPGRIGIGDIWFWACMTNPAASSTYTVEALRDGVWSTVGSGTVSGGFYRFFRAGVGDPQAARARIRFGAAGVRVDEVVVTAAGAFVAMSNPTITTNAVTTAVWTNDVPVLTYGQFLGLGVTAVAQEGAAAITVRAAYVAELTPAETNFVTLAGNPVGGVFAGTLPATAVGTNRYWYVVEYTGLGAAPLRYPLVGFFRYATDASLPPSRVADPVRWSATMGIGLLDEVPRTAASDFWALDGVYLQDGGIQFHESLHTRTIVSPALNGVGTVYFKARPSIPTALDLHIVEVATATSPAGPFTVRALVDVPRSGTFRQFAVTLNDYRPTLYVRLRRSELASAGNRLTIRDIIISPPPADVVIREPSIIAPGYPSVFEPITLFCEVFLRPGSTNYPASGITPRLVWRTGTNAFVTATMTNTAVSGRFALTIPPQPAGPIDYYFRVDFSGPSYTYVDGTNVFFESRSPSYLEWDRASPTNSVQTVRTMTQRARPFRVRMFRSNHQFLELQRYDTFENTPMTLVGDHTWQAILYLTNAVNMDLQFVGTNTYTTGALAYGGIQRWGDTNQFTVNPPLFGAAVLGGNDIQVDMNYVGFVMFRMNVTNGAYQVRRAAFQDFNAWQASNLFFEESLGLFNIKTYATDLDLLPVTVPAVRPTFTFEETPLDIYSPPFAPTRYITGWRLDNAWVLQDRRDAVGMTNRAVHLHAGAGSIESRAESVLPGRDALSLRHRVTFGDENVPYFRHGFTWTNYTVRARIGVTEASPGPAAVSLIGFYYDRDNFYELRLSQVDAPAAPVGTTARVEGQIFRKLDGVYTPVSTVFFSTNNVELLSNSWEVSLTLQGGGVGAPLVGASVSRMGSSVTNTVLPTADGGAGILNSGGTIGFNVRDAVANFLNITVEGAVAPAFVNTSASAWYLGGAPLGGSGNRWTFGAGVLSRPRPNVPFAIQVVRTGESLDLPFVVAWSNAATVTSAALSYNSTSVDLQMWDNVYVRVRPQLADGLLVVDNLASQDWRGRTILDPNLDPSGDPELYTFWQAREAYVTVRGGVRMIELTRSRANPANNQMIVSPVLENGLGSILFPYEVTGGTCVFVVERNIDSGRVDPDILAQWRVVTNVTASAGASGVMDLSRIGVNMVGRLRIRLLPATSPGATLWIGNIRARDYPPRDATSWEAYNALITNLQIDRAFEPDEAEHRTAFLNNSPMVGVEPPSILNENMPFIQSPEIATGIGEIGFWYRAWDPTAPVPGRLRLFVAPSATSTNWVELTHPDPVTDALYKMRLSNITNSAYEYFSIEVFDKDNTVLRVYSDFGPNSRVAVDNIMVTEPVRTSIDILDVRLDPVIPLGRDTVGFEVWLGNPRMNPENIRVFVDYHLGTNVWGVANWGANPALYTRIELQVSPTNQFYFTTPANVRVPARPVDSVVQYRAVVTYTGIFASPIEYTAFTNPAWYYPVNLNATYAHVGFAPHYFVFSAPTGAVFVSEFFYAWFAGDANREFIELVGPRNAWLGNWRVDVVNASGSAIADNVVTSYRLPSDAYLHSGTNGWGFYVLGDTSPLIAAHVDFVLPDGGNPLISPPTAARLPSSGGFRLVRGMGAYAQRISYGTSSIASQNMVARGYTYTYFRSTSGEITPRQAIGLGEDRITGNLAWRDHPQPGTPRGMNPGAARLLGVIAPFPDPVEALPGALALAITDIQLASGVVTVRAWATSTNEVNSLSGWIGVLQTNAAMRPGGIGWGSTLATQRFDAAGAEYVFRVPEAAGSRFFRIKADYVAP